MKIEYRNIGLYFNFRVSIFGHMVFLRSNFDSLASMLTCEYYVFNEATQLDPSTGEKLEYSSKYLGTWRFCAHNFSLASVFIAIVILITLCEAISI